MMFAATAESFEKLNSSTPASKKSASTSTEPSGKMAQATSQLNANSARTQNSFQSYSAQSTRPKSVTLRAFLAACSIYAFVIASYWFLARPSESIQLNLGESTIAVGLEQFDFSSSVSASSTASTAQENTNNELLENAKEEQFESPLLPEPTPQVQSEPQPQVETQSKVEPEPNTAPAPTPEPAPQVEKVAPTPEPVVNKTIKPQETPAHKVETRQATKQASKKEVPPSEVKARATPTKQTKAPNTTSNTSNTAANAATNSATNPTQAHATQQVRAGGVSGGSKAQLIVYGKDNHPVLTKIKAAIDQALIYPRKAQLMKAEGVAVVQFTYTPQGRIKGLRLLKSTGHKELDKAALITIKRAHGNFPSVNQAFTLRLPIAFEIR